MWVTCEVCGEAIEEEDDERALAGYGEHVGPAEEAHLRGHFWGHDDDEEDDE